jgi:hypothetical protein
MYLLLFLVPVHVLGACTVRDELMGDWCVGLTSTGKCTGGTCTPAVETCDVHHDAYDIIWDKDGHLSGADGVIPDIRSLTAPKNSGDGVYMLYIVNSTLFSYNLHTKTKTSWSRTIYTTNVFLDMYNVLPDSKSVLVVDESGTDISIVDILDGALLMHQKGVRKIQTIAVSKDNQTCAVTYGDGSLSILHLSNLSIAYGINQFNIDQGPLDSVAFSQNSLVVYVANEYTIGHFDLLKNTYTTDNGVCQTATGPVAGVILLLGIERVDVYWVTWNRNGDLVICNIISGDSVEIISLGEILNVFVEKHKDKVFTVMTRVPGAVQPMRVVLNTTLKVLSSTSSILGIPARACMLKDPSCSPIGRCLMSECKPYIVDEERPLNSPKCPVKRDKVTILTATNVGLLLLGMIATILFIVVILNFAYTGHSNSMR